MKKTFRVVVIFSTGLNSSMHLVVLGAVRWLVLVLLLVSTLNLYAVGSSDGEQVAGMSNKKSNLQILTLALDWTPNTNHIGAYVAKYNNYFNDEGLFVNIIVSSVTPVETMVAHNNAHFGFSFQESTTFARASATSVPVVALAAVLQHNTSGFAAPKSKHITHPSEFKHKKYGAFGSPIEEAMLDSIMRKNGGTVNDIIFIQTDTLDFFQGTSSGIFDFSWVFEGWTNIEAELKNIQIDYIPLRELDPTFDYYTPIIISSEAFITEHEDLTRRFMSALKKGYEWAVANPLEAANILLFYASELDVRLVQNSMQYLAPKFIDDAPYWGNMRAEVWDRYTRWLKYNNFIDSAFNSDGMYTNKFIEPTVGGGN